MITIIVTNVVAVVVVIIIIITVVIVSIQEPFIVFSSVTTVSTAQFTHQTAPKENFNVITTRIGKKKQKGNNMIKLTQCSFKLEKKIKCI